MFPPPRLVTVFHFLLSSLLSFFRFLGPAFSLLVSYLCNHDITMDLMMDDVR